MTLYTRIRPFAVGLSTYIPGLYQLLSRTGGSVNARYCYAVWMRHLIHAHNNGMKKIPKTIAELGPGDSLGTAICALLSGAEQVFVFDVVRYAPMARNLTILSEVIELFRSRTSIPTADEFPQIKPSLESYEFPHHILTDKILRTSLNPKRIARIRKSLKTNSDMIVYQVPWNDSAVLKSKSVDLILSQAVMEHVVDVSATYRAMNLWLKDSGFLTHQVDFRSHATSPYWNGHWFFSKFAWNILVGNRPYFLNRMPYSYHKKCVEQEGCQILFEQCVTQKSIYSFSQLPLNLKPYFRESDLTTSGAFFVARKKQTK